MREQKLVCVSWGKEVLRLPRDEARQMIALGWHYVPKSVWRRKRHQMVWKT
jgi:hypothetical protein